MNKDFIDALNQLAAERNLDRNQLLQSFEEALEQAYERNVEPGKQIEVVIDPNSGELEVLVIRKVVEEITDPDKEILLSEALELDDTVEVGMEMEFPVDPESSRASPCKPRSKSSPRKSAKPNARLCLKNTKTAQAKF
jgi:transcription termination/antitermination protein NusA